MLLSHLEDTSIKAISPISTSVKQIFISIFFQIFIEFSFSYNLCCKLLDSADNHACISSQLILLKFEWRICFISKHHENIF